ncbi:MAG: YlcI/YnfO family protein [Acidimicrobiales bacterium]
MLLAPIVEGLEDDLKRAAAVGGEDTRRVADVLVEALGSAVRLRFLDALQQAADELTASLPGTSVEVRLQGSDPILSLTVTTLGGTSTDTDSVERTDAEVARVTLRLPEALKTQAERAAARDGVSLNSWLVDAAAHALRLPPAPRRGGRRMTGFVRG